MSATEEQGCIAQSPFSRLIEECASSSDFQHCVNILNTGDEALLARIHLIRAAKSSVLIQTYIWKNDEIGQLFIYELIKVARRGVKVKLLIDSWASETSPGWVAGVATAHPNLELKYYNPSAKEARPSTLEILYEMVFHFTQINKRMHNKLFIVDDHVGIVGGRNYQNDYYDRGTAMNFKDRDVLVIGPVVGDMVKSFMDYWSYQLSIYAKDLVDVRQVIANKNYRVPHKGGNSSVESQFEVMSKNSLNYDHIQKVFIKQSFRVSDIQFIVDKPGKNQSSTLEGGGVVFDEFIGLIRRVKRSIVAQSPYLVLGRKLFSSIKELRKINPQLDILISTNSLSSTDNIYTYSYACKMRKKYIKDLLFRVFELKSFPVDYGLMMGYIGARKASLCVHAKTFVIDDEFVWIGSLNVDPRSYNLNTEVAVIINDKEVAKAVKENILIDLAPQNSWTVGRRANIPLVTHASGFLTALMKYVPIKKIWPYRYTDNFELRKEKTPVPFYDDRFYDHYDSAGPYPGMNLTLKEAEVMLLKAFIEIVRPLL